MDAERSSSTIAGRYELRELIGRGGMGEVYAAWDHQLQREVALKRLRHDVAHHPAMRTRVEAEARAAGSVVHPNVVTVFDSGVENGHPFIVMERLDGRNLADELRGGPMSIDAVRSMAIQVLHGLGAAHGLGVLHRDVKPSNVLSTVAGGWKVADFGIAKLIDSNLTLTATNEVLGSPAYMAPERVTGEPSTERSDLYAVGVLMYEAVTGRKPFDDEHPLAIAMRVREGDHESLASLLPETDRSFADLVERSMALDPAHRFTSAHEMAVAVSNLASGVALDATQPIEPTTSTQRLPLVPPLDTTAPPAADLPSVTSTSSEPTAAVTEPKPSVAATEAKRWEPRRVLGTVLVAAVLTMALLTAGAFALLSSGNERPTRPDRTGSKAAPSVDRVPSPLQDALDRLEEAIAP